MTQFRARGHYISSNRDSWVTTVWRNTRKAAEEDIAAFVRTDNYSQVWIESRGVN